MVKKGVIESVDGEFAVVKIKRECACAGAKNCDTNCFSFSEGYITARVKNDAAAVAGDIVEVEAKSSSILTYAAIVFIFPLFAGFLFYYVGTLATENLFLPYIISMAGFFTSAVVLYYFLNRFISRRENFRITQICTKIPND